MPAVLVPIESGKPIVLDKPIVLVGRHPDCDAVILNNRKISRKHCAIALVNNSFVVRDLGSMNGIWVNGERVEHQAPVRFGDELMIGDVRFTLEADKSGAGKPKPAAGKAREQTIPTKPVADVKPNRKKPMISPPQSEMSMEFPVPLDDEDDGFDVPPPAEKALGTSTDGDDEDVIRVKADKPGAGKSKSASNKSPTPVVPVKPARQKAVVTPPQSELSMEFAVPIDDDEDDGLAVAAPAPAPAPVPVIPAKPAVVDVAPATADAKPAIAEAMPAPQQAIVTPPQSEPSLEFAVPIDDEDDAVAVPPAVENVASTNGDGEDVSPLKAEESGAGKPMPASDEVPAPAVSAMPPAADVKPAPLIAIVTPPQPESSREIAVPIDDEKEEGSAVSAALESAHGTFEREDFIAEDDSFTVPQPAEKVAGTDSDGKDVSLLRADAPEAGTPKPMSEETPAPVFPAKLADDDVAPTAADATPAPPKAMVGPPQSELSLEFAVPIDDEDDAVADPPPAPAPVVLDKPAASDVKPVVADAMPAPQIATITPPQPVLSVEVSEPIVDKKENGPVVPPPPKRDLGSFTFVEGDDFIADSGSFVVPPPAEEVAATAVPIVDKEDESPAVPPPPKRAPGTFTYVEGDDFIAG